MLGGFEVSLESSLEREGTRDGSRLVVDVSEGMALNDGVSEGEALRDGNALGPLEGANVGI